MKLSSLISTRTHRITTAILFALLLGILIGALNDTENATMIRSGDFPGFYVQAEIMQRGYATRLYDFGLQRTIQNELWPELHGSYNPAAYPPFTALLLYPLAWFDHQTAQYLFTAIMLGLFALSIWLVGDLNPALRPYRYPLSAALLLTAPIFCAIFGAQNTMACTALLLFSSKLQGASIPKARVLSGILLGIAFFKPQYAAIYLLGSMCINPSKELLKGCCMTLGLFWIISAFIFGPNWIAWWMHSIAPFDQVNLLVNINETVSIRGILTAMQLPYGIGWTMTIVATCALISILYKKAPYFNDSRSLYALLLAWLPLIAPQTLFYDLPLGFFGYLLVVDLSRKKTLSCLIAIAALSDLLLLIRNAGVVAAFSPVAILVAVVTTYEVFVGSRAQSPKLGSL